MRKSACVQVMERDDIEEVPNTTLQHTLSVDTMGGGASQRKSPPPSRSGHVSGADFMAADIMAHPTMQRMFQFYMHARSTAGDPARAVSGSDSDGRGQTEIINADIEAPAQRGVHQRRDGPHNTGGGELTEEPRVARIAHNVAAAEEITAGTPEVATRGASRRLPVTPSASVSAVGASVIPNRSPVGFSSENDRRNYLRRQRTEYIRNQRNFNGEGNRTHIPTDALGNVIALKTVLNRSIRDIAGKVLDVNVKEFAHHPAMSFEVIEHDLHRQYTFNPPLQKGYVREYLQEALSWTRYQWRCYWRKHGGRHPQCPAKRFPALVALWTSEASESESHMMRAKRMKRNPCRPPSVGGQDDGTTYDATADDGTYREEVCVFPLSAIIVANLESVCSLLEL